MIFLNKHYAQTHSPHYATTPRAFLLSFTQIAPPHALLVAHWGSEGAAVLSLPTREYFQSSGWVEEPNTSASAENASENGNGRPDAESVRSGSSYWAAPGARAFTPTSSSAFTAGGLTSGESSSSQSYSHSPSRRRNHNHRRDEDDDDNDSQGTETPGNGDEGDDDGALDEVGSQDAFVAGMIYALSRKIMPGAPYTPSAAAANESPSTVVVTDERQKWRLDECLRFVLVVFLSYVLFESDFLVLLGLQQNSLDGKRAELVGKASLVRWRERVGLTAKI